MNFRDKQDYKDKWHKALKEFYGEDFPDSIINFTSELSWSALKK